jgi:hypothetical protein
MDKHAQDLARKIISILEDIKRLIVDALAKPQQKQESANKQTDTSNSQQNQSRPNTENPKTTSNPTITGQNPPVDHKKERFPKLVQFKPVIEAIGICFLVIYTAVTIFLWCESRKANRIAQSAFSVSQRAYVTIGRNDGVVADFIVPSDPSKNAEMVNYFQNTGHIPAKFGWGVMSGFTSSKDSGIAFSHRWTAPFGRTFDKKQKAISETGDSTIIASNSIYVATMGVISQKDLNNLPNTSPGMFILGTYQYCDELGNQDMREFSMSYRTGAPSSALSFSLGNDTSWLTVLADAQRRTPDALFPCQTITEKQKQK